MLGSAPFSREASSLERVHDAALEEQHHWDRRDPETLGKPRRVVRVDHRHIDSRQPLGLSGSSELHCEPRPCGLDAGTARHAVLAKLDEPVAGGRPRRSLREVLKVLLVQSDNCATRRAMSEAEGGKRREG